MKRVLACIIIYFSYMLPAISQEMSGYVSGLYNRFSLENIEISDLSEDPLRMNSAVLFTTLIHTHELEIHRMRGAIHNVVYTGPEGHKEAVFEFDIDENDMPIEGTSRPVTDCFNQASYNYYSPREFPYAHFTADILPWLEMGNCRNDPTSISERIEAYMLDFNRGMDILINSSSGYYAPNFIDDKNDSQLEGLSFLLKALELGGLNIIELSPSNFRNREFRTNLSEALEAGLKEMLVEA